MRFLQLFFLTFLFSCTFSPEKKTLSITEDGVVKEDFFSLIQEFGYKGQNDLDSLNDFCQKNFLRKLTEERWDVVDDEEVKKKRKLIIDTFKKYNFGDLIPPDYTVEYENVVVLGASVERMRTRLASLKNYLEKGLKYRKIFLLTGMRPINLKVESDEILYNESLSAVTFQKNWKRPDSPPKTEYDLSKLAWNQVMPEGEYEATFLTSPMKEGGARPTTPDTIEMWLRTRPKKGKVLFISNNPYIQYQHAVALSALLKFSYIEGHEMSLVETVGEGSQLEKQTLKVLLDNLARTLYSEREFWKTLQEKEKTTSWWSRLILLVGFDVL